LTPILKSLKNLWISRHVHVFQLRSTQKPDEPYIYIVGQKDTVGGSSVSQKPEDQAKDLLDAYGKILDIWKVLNDNYFKRGQVAMGIVQVGLFLTVVKMLSPPPTTSHQAVLPIVIAVLGVLSGIMWIRLNEKQIQYIEFCRRTLRNIENKLGELQVPLEYFTLEALVFGPHQECPPPYSASREVLDLRKKKRSQLTFRWSGEKYPETDPNGKPLHSIARVSGGMVSFETHLARGAVVLWVVIALTLITACSIPSTQKASDTKPTTSVIP